MAAPITPSGAAPTIKKLPKLPPNARVTKRPLHHSAIPSPYTGSQNQKIVFVSAKTPFLSAVKRVEKLLRLADKRLVQSATTTVQHNNRKRKRGKSGDGDDIGDIAAEVERTKRKRRRLGGGNVEGGYREETGDVGMEEVVLKATGKAIQRGLELGDWFRSRDGEFAVRLKTGSVKAIDDVEIVEDEKDGSGTAEDEIDRGDREIMEADGVATKEELVNEVPETRIRYTSVLEVYVSLR